MSKINCAYSSHASAPDNYVTNFYQLFNLYQHESQILAFINSIGQILLIFLIISGIFKCCNCNLSLWNIFYKLSSLVLTTAIAVQIYNQILFLIRYVKDKAVNYTSSRCGHCEVNTLDLFPLDHTILRSQIAHPEFGMRRAYYCFPGFFIQFAQFHNINKMFKIQKAKSELILDLDRGAKIMKLILNGVTVIEVVHEDNFLGSGSYLMYPWVNRVQEYHQKEFTDGNGLPLHGLYATKKRIVKEIKQSEEEILVVIRCQKYLEQYPEFEEIFTLKANKLILKFKMDKSENTYCFGYHPYLQFNNRNLKQSQYETDLKEHLKLQQSLLPYYPYQASLVTKITPHQKYDSLFRNGTYFTIHFNQKESVTIRSDLQYWQIYTPDEHRIAVEPMSFTANVFEINAKDKHELVNEGFLEISVTC